MSTTLTSEQQKIIGQAIQSGMIGSVDEFIDSAVGALLRDKKEFDRQKAPSAGERIREFRKGVTLDLRGMSIRELVHIGHKY